LAGFRVFPQEESHEIHEKHEREKMTKKFSPCAGPKSRRKVAERHKILYFYFALTKAQNSLEILLSFFVAFVFFVGNLLFGWCSSRSSRLIFSPWGLINGALVAAHSAKRARRYAGPESRKAWFLLACQRQASKKAPQKTNVFARPDKLHSSIWHDFCGLILEIC
jgi:hypothetical protein